MSRVYSAIRDTIVNAVQAHPVVHVDFTPKEGESDDDFHKLMDLSLHTAFYVQIMPIGLKLKLNDLCQRLFKASPTQSIEFNINNDPIAVAWLLAYGVVDSEGKYIFDETQALLWSGAYEGIVYRLCWEVLKANGYGPQVKQELVGNSEGTKLSSASSEPQAV